MVNWVTSANGASLSLNASVALNAGTLAQIMDGDDTTYCQLRCTGGAWALRVDLGQPRLVNSFRSLISRSDGPTDVSFVPEPASPPTGTTAYADVQYILYAGDSGVVSLWRPVTARYWQFVWNGQPTGTLTNVYSMELRDDAGTPWGVMARGPSAGTGGASINDVENELKSYLSATPETNIHHDDLPWQTKVELDAIKVEVDDIQAKGNGVNGFAAIKAVADATASVAGGTAGTIASAVTAITGQAATVAGQAIATAGPTLTSISGDIASVENHYLDVIAKLGARGASGDFSGDPASAWTMLDETDWQGALAWSVPADLYVVTVTDLAGRTGVDVAGVPWYPRLGWWAPLNGTQVGARRYFDFANCQLVVEGGNMPGVLLKTSPLMAGHIQAWRRA